MEFGLLIISLLAGVSSFFSPCSFPLLPTYIAFVARESGREKDIFYGLRIGFLASIGLLLVYIIMTVIQLSLVGAIAFFYSKVVIILAFILIALGFLNLFKYGGDHIGRLAARVLNPFVSRVKVGESLFLYGVVYGLSSLTCSGPLLFMIATLAVARGLTNLFVTIFPYLFSLFLMMLFFTALSTYVGYYLSSLVNKYISFMDKLFSVLLIISGVYIALYELEILVFIT